MRATWMFPCSIYKQELASFRSRVPESNQLNAGAYGRGGGVGRGLGVGVGLGGTVASRRSCRCRCRSGSSGCSCCCSRRCWTSGRATAIDVNYVVHVRETNVRHWHRIGCAAIGRANVTCPGLWIWIRADKEDIVGRISIRCYHFHHQLERPSRYAYCDRQVEYGVRLIWDIEQARSSDLGFS